MPFGSHETLAGRLLPAVLEAGRVILDTRARGLIVDTKADRSPVTDADRMSETILVAALDHALPGIPVVAEEASSGGIPPSASGAFFLVDPLDGTRDYCAGRDEFTINIGLIDGGRPVFGLIYAPARAELFVTAAPGRAVAARLAVTDTPVSLAALAPVALTVRRPVSSALHALLSRSESGPDHARRVTALGAKTAVGVSSALKFCMIARGEADLYPRFGPTCEWDTAAGQAILEAAGGSVTQLDGSPMVYGKAAAHYLNGPFLARGGRPA